MKKLVMNVMKKVFVGGMLACMLLTAVNVNSDAGVAPVGLPFYDSSAYD